MENKNQINKELSAINKQLDLLWQRFMRAGNEETAQEIYTILKGVGNIHRLLNPDQW